MITYFSLTTKHAIARFIRTLRITILNIVINIYRNNIVTVRETLPNAHPHLRQLQPSADPLLASISSSDSYLGNHAITYGQSSTTATISDTSALVIFFRNKTTNKINAYNFYARSPSTMNTDLIIRGEEGTRYWSAHVVVPNSNLVRKYGFVGWHREQTKYRAETDYPTNTREVQDMKNICVFIQKQLLFDEMQIYLLLPIWLRGSSGHM